MIQTNIIPEVSGIYKITNKINNKCYIGQAQNLKVRIRGHLRGYKKNKNNNYFYNSIQKHSLQNFEVEILVQGNFNQDELNDLEVDFIRLFNSNNQKFGYNLTEGGGGVSGLKHTDESKQKNRLAHLGKKLNYKHTDEIKKQISESKKGKPKSEEHKQKLREANLGKKLSKETKKKIGILSKGRRHTEETKQKMRIKIKNRKPISEETRQRLIESHKGKPLSKESIEKREKTKRLNFFKKQLTELFYNELMKI